MLVTSLAVGGFAIAVHAPPASACSCLVTEGAEQFGFADVAFSGTLEEVDSPADPTTSLDAVSYGFSVDTVYKGSTDSEAVVYSANNSASCGLEGLVVGSRYVVYATVIRFDEEAAALPGSARGGLTSGLCSGTAEVDAEGVPAFLGAGRPPTDAPPANTPSAADDDGTGWIVPTVIGVGAVAVIGAGAFAFTRRGRRGAADPVA
jgi:hypothetical protein